MKTIKYIFKPNDFTEIISKSKISIFDTTGMAGQDIMISKLVLKLLNK